MKRILYSCLLLCSLTVGFTSCDDETSQDNSKITYYPEISLKGDAYTAIPVGQAYQEAGCAAEIGGNDVSSDVKVNGSVDTSKPGIYTLTYLSTNEDGFSASATRQVVVYDPTPSSVVSGVWYSTADSYRVASSTTAYGAAYPIIIYQVAPGEFYVSDFLGGWYDQRATYGSAYAVTGKFKLNSDNTMTLEESYNAGWGDELDGLDAGKYDPATKQISWNAGYAGMHFYLTLTQN